jgi:predicted phage tail protein
MRLVKVYGQLAKRLGQRVFRADVASPAEAVRFLCANFPGLDQWLIDSDQDGIGYRVKVSKTTVGEEDFGLSCNPDATISITPVLTGAGGGTGKILAGIGLIAASFLFPGAGLFGAGFGVFGPLAPATIATLTTVGTVTSAIGASLVLGGVAEMITPKPTPIGAPSGQGQSPINDPRALQSFNFNGIQNTSTQGVPIPLVYGKVFVGSVAISAGVFNTSKI